MGKNKSNKSVFRVSQIYLPIIIGLIVVGWMFLKEFNASSFKNVHFTWESSFWIFVAFLFIFGRDFGITWRFKYMTDNKISWKQAFQIHILSEFTSAVTPTAVGGSALVILFLNKANISVGKSATIMISNLFLDELFFVLISPIIFAILPLDKVFNSSSALSTTIQVAFWSVYAILFTWTLVLYIALFLRPDIVPRFTKFISKWKFLNRWEKGIHDFADNLQLASAEIAKKSFKFWSVAFVATVLSWSSRFLVVNALFLAFTRVENNLVIFARQILLWIVMTISPTPGGSGLSEYAFKEYYSDIHLGSGPILVIILIWRLISYYLYLIFGAIIIPKWLKKSFGKKDISASSI